MTFTDVDIAPAICFVVVVLGAVLVKCFFAPQKRLKLDRSIPDFDDAESPDVTPDESDFSAVYKPGRTFPLMLLGLSILAWIIVQVWVIYEKTSFSFKPYYLASGTLLILQLILAMLHKPYKAKTGLDDKHVVVLVPVYNESEVSLRHCFEALLSQSRLPNEIHVVNDGSKQAYGKIKRWLLKTSNEHGVEIRWIHKKKNHGKRAAHATALEGVSEKDNTIIVTVDSDCTLDRRAIKEGLKPFEDTRIESVAGIVVAKNATTNFLSRITDLLFVGMQQLVDRSAMSELNSVLVNSGGLAFYRMPVVLDALNNGYTHESFLGRHIEFSDDSYLTLFALLKGKTVQQPTAIVFTDMPVDLSHHVRQQMRWMRGSFIRSFWRIRYLPVLSWGFIRQLVGWLSLFINTIILVELVFVLPISTHKPLPWFILLVPLGLGFVQSARYFTIVRSDMSLKSQIGIFMLSPLAAIWSMVVLRSFRIYGMLTFWKTGWGTRHKVEIENSLEKLFNSSERNLEEEEA